MKLQQYLTEEKVTKEVIHEGIKLVYDNCMPFIKDLVRGGYDYAMKDDPLLYSGRSDNIPIIKKSVRKNRRPADTPEDRHKIMDGLFYKKYGIKARSETLFCTGDYTTAMSYGSGTYIIFPISNYKILWSDEIRDMYKNPYIEQIFMKINTLLNNKRGEIYKNPDMDFDQKSKLFDKAKKELLATRDDMLNKQIMSTYHTDKLMYALRSKHEIMLSCNKYIGLKGLLFKKYIGFYIGNFGTHKPTQEMLEQITDLYPI